MDTPHPREARPLLGESSNSQSQRPNLTTDPLLGRLFTKLGASASSNKNDKPNYWVDNPQCLHAPANLHTFAVGTGDSLFRCMQPAIESAESEVVLITCFWYPGCASLELLIQSLQKLSDKAHRAGTPVNVFLGLSSLSIIQKLLHSSSGKVYDPEEYESKLGFPHPSNFPGLKLQIKSIFQLPFSVMHPKFVIVDRKWVWLPSCNVSWEKWFEGGTLMSGKFVSSFTTFWQEFWEPLAFFDKFNVQDTELSLLESETGTLGRIDFGAETETNAIFLPSPHHRYPQYFSKEAPPTPLNVFILLCTAEAKKRVFIQTPNVTSAPFISSLKDAICRGVHVHIRTSENLMVLEQLVTAFTTTSRCIDSLVAWYATQKTVVESHLKTDPEMQAARKLGRLKVEYFQSVKDAESKDNEPVQSHIKMSVFDDQIAVLGSGNMDRASWFTSQELGCAIRDPKAVQEITEVVNEAMMGRVKLRFDSDEGKNV
jgi:phosphatidylserine/phosphatidylglycerophosphate/cardiolipin synthase-like enzyme